MLYKYIKNLLEVIPCQNMILRFKILVTVPIQLKIQFI